MLAISFIQTTQQSRILTNCIKILIQLEIPFENGTLGFNSHLLAISSILWEKKMFVVGKWKENAPYKTMHCSLAHKLKSKWAALGLLSWKILERSSKFAGEKEKMH